MIRSDLVLVAVVRASRFLKGVYFHVPSLRDDYR